MHPILFRFGPVAIYTYGFFVFLGVLAGFSICCRAAKADGINKNDFFDIIFWTIISSFLGAKLLYVFVAGKSFLENPFVAIRSGFVFYGGVILGGIALIFLAKRYKLDFFRLSDVICMGIPLGHTLGRLGCFFNGCCYGKTIGGGKAIPIQLISAAALFGIFFMLILIWRKRRFYGQVSIGYITLYGIFRFVIEFFRGDPRGKIFFLSTGQFISLILIGLGLVLWGRLNKDTLNHKKIGV